MADILCPNCGMPNPDDQNICSFCRQPLRSPEDTNSIRPGDMPIKKSTAELEPILPQWLRDAREKSRQSSDDEPEVPSQPAAKPAAQQPPAEPTDWLAGLAAAGREGDQDEVPEWMRSPQAPPPPAKQEKVEETFPRRQEIRWDSEPAEEPAKPAEEPSDDGVPFWMKGLEEEPTDKKEVSDFLSKQDASKQGIISPFEAGSFRPNTGELFNWMDEPKPEETAAPASSEPSGGEGLPDWIANLGRTDPTPAPTPPAPAPSEPAGFDWLKEEASKPFAPFQRSQVEEPSIEEGFTAAGLDLPDWMQSAAEETPAAPQASDSGLSDWLKPADETPAAPAEETGLPDWMKSAVDTPPAQADDSGLPDWMRSFADPSTPAQDAGAIPDWMKSAAETPAPQTEEPALDWLKPAAETPAPQTEEPALDWLKPAAETPAPQSETADNLDWLKPAAETPAPQTDEPAFDWLKPATETPAPAESTADFDFPAWMSAAQSAESQEQPASQIPAQPSAPAFMPGDELQGTGAADELFSADMPDWLSNVAPVEQKSSAAQPDQSLGQDIAPADLPSWVQAMRPVETALPESPVSGEAASQTVEDRGPLAGLFGVLPTIPGFDPAGRPKTYSIRLQPSQDQMDHATQLEQMLAAETDAKPFRAGSSVVRAQRALRWAITGILLIVVTALLLLGMQFLPLPAALSPEADLARNAIIALPNEAPILMIFDYEPALAGELETAAASFVDQMIGLHNPSITVLSTSPTGAALADRFMSGSEMRRSYRRGENYINLGYLAGESAGILAFASNPHATLQANVNDFSDYALVILLTDRAETARAWVEQTTGHRNGRPFLVISSAQAAPMIQPYLLSGQVNGLVSGLYDGAAFEQSTNSAGSARLYWDAYNISLLVVCVLIVIGGLWNFALGMRIRRQGLDEA